jgi:hypothetical protein
MDAIEIIGAYKNFDTNQKIVVKRGIEICDANFELEQLKARVEMAICAIENVEDASLSAEWIKKNILGL